MKARFFSVIALFALTTTLLEAQVEFGILAGPNFQNMVGKDYGGEKITNGLLTGFHAGMSVNVPLATDFYFQTGLLFSQKGSMNNLGFFVIKATTDYNTTTRISYLDLPLHLLFRPGFGGGHILVGFGPYVGFGLFGTETIDYNSLPALEKKVKFKSNITTSEFWDIDYAYYRRFDAGADIFAGYELDMGLWFRLNAQLGLLDMIPDVEESNNSLLLKNTGFGVSIGYNF